MALSVIPSPVTVSSGCLSLSFNLQVHQQICAFNCNSRAVSTRFRNLKQGTSRATLSFAAAELQKQSTSSRSITPPMASAASVDFNSNAAAEHQVANDASKAQTKGKVVIVGAGPAGCLLALLLHQRGFQIYMFERRPMMGVSDFKGNSRSYPILLTIRGLKSITSAGVELPPYILKQKVGSISHLPNGKEIKLDYYSAPGIQSFFAGRNALVAYLQRSLLQRSSNVHLHFGWELSSIDDSRNIAKFFCSHQSSDAQDNRQGMEKTSDVEVEFYLLVGADGISSKTRSEILRIDQNSLNPHITFDFKENPISYKSFYISPSIARRSKFIHEHDRVHGWRGADVMLINIADGSYWGGTFNDQILNAESPEFIEKILREKVPDVCNLLLQENPHFAEELWRQENKKGPGSVILSQFHFKNIVLIGDAAHAMFPTLGTGCNSALEDCLIFDKIVEELTPSDGRAFPYHLAAEEFTKRRIKDAHDIVKMNMGSFLLPSSRLKVIQEVIFRTFHKFFPRVFAPSAYQLLWTETPYSEIMVRKQRENKIFYGIVAALGILIAAMIIFLCKRLVFHN